VVVEGRELAGAPPEVVMSAGVGRIPEDRHASLVLDLPVSLNLIMEHIDDFTVGGRLDRRAIAAHARTLIERFGIRARPDDRVATLSGGNIQKVLLARVLSRDLASSSSPSRRTASTSAPAVRSRRLWRGAAGAAILLVSRTSTSFCRSRSRHVLYERWVVGGCSRAGGSEQLGMPWRAAAGGGLMAA
jgi:simple sugar transport system ATP-binding protein